MKRFAAVLLLIVVLAGCSQPEGSKFDVTGQVIDPGSESIRIVVTERRVDEYDWFTKESHQIHDNSNDHGMWNGNKTYGKVYDYERQEIDPIAVEVNSCVRMVGQIRSHQMGKTHSHRPVFDTARMVQCER